MKKYLIWLWAKYKERYGVQIYEFIVMDNHAHLLVNIESVERLGHFMRTVNSQLARLINKIEGRDSQAIRERYKSPLITNERYMLKTMQYIWLNRFQINKRDPATDPFCSVSWRLNSVIKSFLFKDEKKLPFVSVLLSSYPHFEAKIGKFRRFIRDLLNAAISSCCDFLDSVFQNGHTIGDKVDVRFRTELLLAFRRERVPIESWN